MRELRTIAQERGEDYREDEGGRHTKVRIGDRIIMVPRHREINENTARGILKGARR